jgi:hypothetical protein
MQSIKKNGRLLEAVLAARARYDGRAEWTFEPAKSSGAPMVIHDSSLRTMFSARPLGQGVAARLNDADFKQVTIPSVCFSVF